MSNDWISPDKAHNFSVDKFYVGLTWTKMVDKGLENMKQNIGSIFDVLQVAEDKAVNILVTGRSS